MSVHCRAEPRRYLGKSIPGKRTQVEMPKSRNVLDLCEEQQRDLQCWSGVSNEGVVGDECGVGMGRSYRTLEHILRTLNYFFWDGKPFEVLRRVKWTDLYFRRIILATPWWIDYLGHCSLNLGDTGIALTHSVWWEWCYVTSEAKSRKVISFHLILLGCLLWWKSATM